jgi:hypothetical protein
MTHTQFRKAIDHLGISQLGIARLCSVLFDYRFSVLALVTMEHSDFAQGS